MTYNRDDWEAGDLAWISHTTLPRELRVLAARRDGREEWWGSRGYVRAASPHIIDAERAVAVTPDEANRARCSVADTEVSGSGYARQSVGWAPGSSGVWTLPPGMTFTSGDTIHVTHATVYDASEPPVSRMRVETDEHGVNRPVLDGEWIIDNA